MRLLAQARNPYSLSWLWIPGSRFARPGMTKEGNNERDRLRTPLPRRARRRLCVRPCRLRHRPDGAWDLALCAATCDGRAAGFDLFGHRPNLAAAEHLAQH